MGGLDDNECPIVHKLDDGAISPKFCNVYSRESEIGFYIFSKEPVSIPAHSVGLIDTGVTLTLVKDDYYIQLFTPITLANAGIEVLGGVIDSDYTGTIKVIIYNTLREDLEFSVGDAVSFACALKIEKNDVEKLLNCNCENINLTRCICDTQKIKFKNIKIRMGGFGSTNAYKA